MNLPPPFREEAERLPPLLRALLEAELAAGNSIAEVGHSFPAPPAGAYFKLSARVTSRPHESGGGLTFRAVNGSAYSGFFTDEGGFYFIVEPPLPYSEVDESPRPAPPPRVEPDPESALARFERSMVIDYEKWHDGIGYDIGAIDAASPAERAAIEALLLRRGARDWRDVEALAALNTPRAGQELERASRHSDPDIRLAVVRYVPQLVPDSQRTASLIAALETAKFGGGLSQALDEAAEFHPPEVVRALLRGAIRREGEATVHCAALLLYIHGQADSPFDWSKRPFFLRFHTEDRRAREEAFRELCAKIGVDPSEYL